MVAPRLFLCLALLLPATFSHAADATNSHPPASSQKPPADIEGSPEWVQKMLRQNNSDAVDNLALKYAAGDGVPKDEQKAVQLFFSAAAGGDFTAEHNLGASYINGIGLPKNTAKGVDWMKVAARDGYPPAQLDLGRIYLTRFVGPPDFAKAFALISASAAQAYPPAEAKLGGLYQEGIGVKRDMVEALKWLQLAVDAGFKEAVPRRDEVASLMDAQQKDEAKTKTKSFSPETNHVRALDDSKQVSVPLGNYFQIPVKILGKTNSLIVDTGSSSSLLDFSFQDHLGKPLVSIQGSTTSSSTATFALYDCPEIFIGERRFVPLLTILEDFTKWQQITGEPLGGIFGMNSLRYEVICFDSDHESFSIGGSVPETVKRNAMALPIEKRSNSDYGINVSINGHGPIFLSMDSGDTDCIDLNKTDWQKIFSGVPIKSRRDTSADAEGKIVEGLSARLQSLTIGTNHYHNLIAGRLANSESSSRFGQEFIRRHVCYVDFPTRMLYLLPGRDFDRPEEYDMSGLHLLKIDEKITVRLADEDAPGFQAGIRANDQILSINGTNASTLHLKSIYETLKAKPGNEIKMQVKHGDQTNSVTFRLKRLL